MADKTKIKLIVNKEKKMGIIAFFKKAFADMASSARAQHEADACEFEAVRN